MLKIDKRFIDDECGAITVDWVVLTAAVVGLGGLVISQLTGGTSNLATGVKNGILEVPVETDL